MSLMERCRECGQEFPYVDSWTIFCPACDRITQASDRHRPINEANRCPVPICGEHKLVAYPQGQVGCEYCARSEAEVMEQNNSATVARCVDCLTPCERDGRDPKTVRCAYCDLSHRLFDFTVDAARREFKR